MSTKGGGEGTKGGGMSTKGAARAPHLLRKQLNATTQAAGPSERRKA